MPTIKPGAYDGSTALETHLAKFENCPSYYDWSQHDRLFHLKASLDGHAGHVLWQIDVNSTEADIYAGVASGVSVETASTAE